ncbi:MAG: Rrf2 family transcriptional regulator [Clostridia bacterium]|nr:Rrf2 family transcriptional regulator [Clostridia bacterium]
MMISTRGRYALRVMIDMAEHSSGEHIPMKDIAHRQQISLKYMEKIMPLLVSEQLVEGVHGKGGGYKLTRKPEEYHVGEILRLTEGDLAPVACLECGAEPCERAGECRTLPMWIELNKVINDYLDGVTLDQLMRPEPGAGIGAGLDI